MASLNGKKIRWNEWVLEKLFFLCAFVSVITTAAVIYILIEETLAFFETVPVLDFSTSP